MMHTLIRKTVSARSSVLGEIVDFCRQNGIESSSLADGLCETVFALGEFREEGVQLFPTVYMTQDIAVLASMLPSGSFIELGVGPPVARTASQALKCAAPLAAGGWSIYMERSLAELRFGVFRAAQVPLALTASDLLLSDGEPTDIVAIESPAPSMTLLSSGRGDRIEFRFRGARETERSPQDEIRRFVADATLRAPNADRESVATYAEKLVGETLRHSHGALLAILGSGRRKVPSSLRDAVILDPPLEFCSVVSEFRSKQDAQAMAELESRGQLLSGMIQSDGITLMRADFAVMAFRVFVRLPRGSASSTAEGGARTRAFAALASRIGNDLDGVLFRSQDGRTQYEGITDA